jgi:hypothetical protein
MDEGDVVDKEDVPFTHARHVFGSPLGRQPATAAPRQGPGAAERAVSETAPRVLERRHRVKDAEES